MKLYNLALSNFASKSRVAIYEKGLDIELVDPPGGLGSAEYKKVNPLGKVPVLEEDEGFVLPESVVIMEYLEERYPEPALWPADPAERALGRLWGSLRGDDHPDLAARGVDHGPFGDDLARPLEVGKGIHEADLRQHPPGLGAQPR